MAPRPDTSLTAIARAATEHNEEQVLAARALESERRVTTVRLLSLFLAALSQGLISELTGTPSNESTLQAVVIALYFVFAVSSFAAVRLTKAQVVRAQVMPIAASTVDVGFVTAMEYSDATWGAGVQVESTAAMLALIIAYNILRYSTSSLLCTTALAIAAFTATMAWSGAFDWTRWSFVVFVFAALAALLWSTRRAMRTAFVELQRRQSLSKLVPPKVVDEILAGRAEALRPMRREVTVLFADVRGFTTYSESRAPEEVLRFLDDYFGRMTRVVRGHDGSVNKFIGDGLLALWGAPEALEDHAVHAIKAGLDMQKVMAEINEHRERADEPPMQIGIGVHTGEVAAGMLGGAEQNEYSVIGDAVNLASRIEGLTKEHGHVLLASEATWAALGERFEGERVGEFAVKGRRAPVVVYSVTGSRPRAAQAPHDERNASASGA